MGQKLFTSLWLFSLSLLMACTAVVEEQTSTAVVQTDIPTGSIVIGDVSVDRADTIEKLQPTADYIASQLHEYGIGIGEVRVAPDLETMIQWMNNGEIDIYFDSSYPTTIIVEQTEMQPVLRQWRKGIDQYQSVVFSQSDITSLDQLLGKAIAFEEAYSSSGFVLPYTLMLDQGYKFKQVTSLGDPVADDEIGYFFSGSDFNTIELVINGKIAAGAVDSPTYEQDIPDATKERFSELARSVFVPRQIVSLRIDLDPAVFEAIVFTLKEMENSTEGVSAMAQTNTTRFDEFPDGAEISMAFLLDLYSKLDQP